MENLVFGTIDSKNNYTVYNAPSKLSEEMMAKISFSQENYSERITPESNTLIIKPTIIVEQFDTETSNI